MWGRNHQQRRRDARSHYQDPWQQQGQWQEQGRRRSPDWMEQRPPRQSGQQCRQQQQWESTHWQEMERPWECDSMPPFYQGPTQISRTLVGTFDGDGVSQWLEDLDWYFEERAVDSSEERIFLVGTTCSPQIREAVGREVAPECWDTTRFGLGVAFMHRDPVLMERKAREQEEREARFQAHMARQQQEEQEALQRRQEEEALRRCEAEQEFSLQAIFRCFHVFAANLRRPAALFAPLNSRSHDPIACCQDRDPVACCRSFGRDVAASLRYPPATVCFRAPVADDSARRIRCFRRHPGCRT